MWSWKSIVSEAKSLSEKHECHRQFAAGWWRFAGFNFKSFSTHETKLLIPFSLPALLNSMLFTIGSRVPGHIVRFGPSIHHVQTRHLNDLNSVSHCPGRRRNHPSGHHVSTPDLPPRPSSRHWRICEPSLLVSTLISLLIANRRVSSSKPWKQPQDEQLRLRNHGYRRESSALSFNMKAGYFSSYKDIRQSQHYMDMVSCLTLSV